MFKPVESAMRRRDFIFLCAAVMARPGLAHGEPARVVVGVLDAASSVENSSFLATARQGLTDAGYASDNVTVDYRWAESDPDQLPTLASDLVERHPAALFAAGLPAALALKRATATVPTVFVVGPDPVFLGLVTSLSRPNGNLTGVSLYTRALVTRRLALLHQLAGGAEPIGFVVNPFSAMSRSDRQDVEMSARALALSLAILEAGSDTDLDALATSVPQRQVKALLIGNDPFLNSRMPKIIALAAKLAIPAMYGLPEFAEAGGLMSCSTSLDDAYRLGFSYVGRILKGAKVRDLPVVQPTKFQLVVNLRTAQALGLVVPPALLAAADKVIR